MHYHSSSLLFPRFNSFKIFIKQNVGAAPSPQKGLTRTKIFILHSLNEQLTLTINDHVANILGELHAIHGLNAIALVNEHCFNLVLEFNKRYPR